MVSYCAYCGEKENILSLFFNDHELIGSFNLHSIHRDVVGNDTETLIGDR